MADQAPAEEEAQEVRQGLLGQEEEGLERAAAGVVEEAPPWL